MTENISNKNADLLEMASRIVAAYASSNSMLMSELPAMIQSIYQTLQGLESNLLRMDERPQPAVPVKKSVTPDYIICLEDGKKLKMLKRHLKTSFNMTPDQYRIRWGLTQDYPMVAPNYAKQRSSLARDIGLGTSRRKSKGPHQQKQAA
jgi:predicted transcriptional regulator